MPLLINSTQCEQPGLLDIGDQVGQRVIVTDFDDVPTDTASVSLQARKPSGTIVVATVVHEGVGTWLLTLPILDERGIWHWRTASTGLINQVEYGTFRVRPPGF